MYGEKSNRSVGGPTLWYHIYLFTTVYIFRVCDYLSHCLFLSFMNGVTRLIHRGYRGNRWFNSDFAEIRSGSPKQTDAGLEVL